MRPFSHWNLGSKTLQKSSNRSLTAFNIPTLAATGEVNETLHTVSVSLVTGTDVTHLVATFTITATALQVGSTTQTSGATFNDFSSPVTYAVAAEDGSVQTNLVTVVFFSLTSGASWSQPVVPPSVNPAPLAFGAGVFVGVGGNSLVSTSTDGVHWTTTSLPAVATAASTDGVNWVSWAALPSVSTWQDLAFGNGRYVVSAPADGHVAVVVP